MLVTRAWCFTVSMLVLFWSIFLADRISGSTIIEFQHSTCSDLYTHLNITTWPSHAPPPQDESISMNIKLKNLRSAEEDLGKFLGNVVVSSELATSICGDEVNDAYLEYVIELNSKVTWTFRVEICFWVLLFFKSLQVGWLKVYCMRKTPSIGTWVATLYFPYCQIKYIGQTQAAPDGSSLDMSPSSTMAAKGVKPHLENLKAKVNERRSTQLLHAC